MLAPRPMCGAGVGARASASCCWAMVGTCWSLVLQRHKERGVDLPNVGL